MPPTPVDPEQVFHTTLAAGTSLLVAFVPSRDRKGDPVNQEFWVDQILTTLATAFRGATAYPRGCGVWRDDDHGGSMGVTTMLTEQQIREALHASRVSPINVPNPNGPFGLEHVAEAVAHLRTARSSTPAQDWVERPLSLPVSTWTKVEDLARSVSTAGKRRVTTSELITALIEKSLVNA